MKNEAIKQQEKERWELHVVSLEVAKGLKSIGFNLPVDWSYNEKTSVAMRISMDGVIVKPQNHNEHHERISRPTQALAHQWFFEKYGIYITIDLENDGFSYLIQRKPRKRIQLLVTSRKHSDPYEALEDALEQCVLIVIEDKGLNTFNSST